MDGMTEDMWTPCKHIYGTLQQAIAQPKDLIGDLEQCLKKNKHSFTNFLRNPPKNEKSRNQIRAGLTEGIPLGGQGHKLILSQDLIDEAIILSDMFDLDELIAVELLYTAQRQQMHHPGLPRGLVAVLLYYDGRKAMACALRDMMQTMSGVSWVIELPREFLSLVNNYVQNLTEESNLLSRLLDILAEMDVVKENLMLTKNRAFGSTKHQNQVLALYEDIRKAVAMSLFNYSAQRGLPRGNAIRLMKMLAACKCNDNAGGNMDDVTVIMLMALLYSYDTSVLLISDVVNPYTGRLPIMWDPEFAKSFHEALYAQAKWQTPRLDAIIKYSFALALASLRQAPSHLQAAASALIPRDEQLMDEALASNVFGFIYRQLLENEVIYNTESIYRRAHLLITDFIDFMHAKVAELRNRADESARTVISFLNEGLEPPPNLDANFELLMLCVSRLYGDRRANHTLCNEYWGASDTATSAGSGGGSGGGGGSGSGNNAGLYAMNSSRAVSLFKFISLASELLPQTLFKSYLKMITGLTRTELSARSAFNLLKNTPSGSSSFSMGWDHFFQALASYYSNMRTDNAFSVMSPGSASNGDLFMRRALQPRNITQRETEHLVAVMGIMRAVAEHDRVSRVMMCDQASWQAPQVLLGLVACATPLALKAEIMFTLAALAKSKETARAIWFQLEDSQIIPTLVVTTTAAGQSPCSLAEEIEQNESRQESYNLSRGVLQLLHTLMTTHMPRCLGAGPRHPGYDPYFNFLMESIILKVYNRSYKDPSEMWEVAAKGLKLLFYLLATYRPKASDFMESRDEQPYPGYHVMLQLQVKSHLLQLLLRIIEDARERLDEYRRFRGKEHLEECALYALLLLEVAVAKQNAFFEAHSSANSPILMSGLDRMLLDINPRTRRPDYVVKIIKFVTYNNWLPRHSLAAIKILTAVTMLPNVPSQILNMYALGSNEKLEVRQGFVECLEMDARLAQQNEELLDSIVLNDYQAMGDVLHHGGHQPPSVAVDEDESEADITGPEDGDTTLGPCYEVVALNEKMPVGIDLQIKEAVVELFGLNLCQAPPNFVYFLLGIDVLRDFMARDKQQVGIEMQCCCVHSLVLVLEKYLESQRHSQEKYCPHTAHLVERVYQLFQGLCANRRSSETILRFFRLTCNDFLLRHLSAMPFRRHREDHMLHAMSHLLNCVAVEVRLAANHGQMTRYNLLCDILLLGGQSDGQRANPGMPQDLNNDILSGTASANFYGLDVGPVAAAVKIPAMPDKTQGLHANRLLECLELEVNATAPQPQLEFFDPVLTTAVLKQCEARPRPSPGSGSESGTASGSEPYLMINIRKLHDVLHEELRTVQSTIATGQRKAISGEITVLLQYAVEVNRVRTQRIATLRFVDAWCQLVQILFSSMPDALLPLALRRQYIIDIIEKMLLKVEPVQPLIEISIQITETILLLLANLRICYYQLEDQRTSDDCDVTAAAQNGDNSLVNGPLSLSYSHAHSQSNISGTMTGSTSNLRFILKRIVEWIMVSGAKSQKLRINLYTALLNCLRIVKRLRTEEEVDFHESIASRLEKSQKAVTDQRHGDKDRLKEMAAEVIGVYGEKLIDSICHDAVTGHDVCRMLALACLEMISELDAVSTLTEFVVSRGYLKHLLDNVAESDDALSAILQPVPDNLRQLYVYEARLAFLTRLSQTGARMLLAEGALGVLSNMRVYDLQPDLKANQLRKDPEGFLPNTSKRFHSILQPALALCDGIVSSLGSQNDSAAHQVLNFLFAHIDMVETMLRTATPLMDLWHLQQLASITNLFSRTSTPELCTNMADSYVQKRDLEFYNRLNRLQQLMIVVFGRFTVTEATIRQILQQEDVESLPESQKSRHVKYFLDIAANLSLYCRHAVTSHVRDSTTSKFLLTTIVNDVTPLTGRTDGKKLTAIMHTIIEQLKGSVGYYLSQKSHADNLLEQRSSLPNICFGPSGKESYVELSQRHKEKRNELMQAVFIAEQNLYLLWIHLDFYMRNAVIFSSENRSAINESNMESSSGNDSVSVLHATPDEILQLKQHLISTFNETFCSELIVASEEYTVKCKGFNSSLLRRIKALVQFAASNGNANESSFI
ncbi:nuclear pore complex protein Nup205 [Drosophila pseudoobscura]|uniref:Nuclear pore complex protein Nup205 n=1 Tax=Drosophila pseudoobscura pseudoobscura TaxID=46245 RepID=A0A6I8UG43_DROPS|nr:nuclear pore complex protein Nup205 [Drosophila pseudoobscura]